MKYITLYQWAKNNNFDYMKSWRLYNKGGFKEVFKDENGIILINEEEKTIVPDFQIIDTLELYDVITQQTIIFELRKISDKCKELGLSEKQIYKLYMGKEGRIHYKDRFILNKNKGLTFTLVDFDSGEEFECITPKSLFQHLGVKFNRKVGKTNLTKVYNRLLYLKGKLLGNKINAKLFKDFSVKCRAIYENTVFIQKTRNRCGSRIKSALKRAKIKKDEKTIALLGCSYSEFITHIENQFKGGMNWENYGNKRGQWVFDHILPFSRFDLNNKEELKRICHYTNIQPLWSEENREKFNKLPEELL